MELYMVNVGVAAKTVPGLVFKNQLGRWLDKSSPPYTGASAAGASGHGLLVGEPACTLPNGVGYATMSARKETPHRGMERPATTLMFTLQDMVNVEKQERFYRFCLWVRSSYAWG